MSIYNFAPSHNLNFSYSFSYWNDGFSEEEMNKLIKTCEMRNTNKASISGHDEKDDFSHIRKSTVRWIPQVNDTSWIYDRLAFITRQLNGQFFNFNLSGFVEDFQYTVYEANTQDHYDWHVDMGPETNSPRKLSLVLQLSDPSDYEGGELQLLNSANPITIEKKKGHIVAFPSYLLHRVTPVTKGVRKSLVIWVAGPPFK